jgi:hypothetical protein
MIKFKDMTFIQPCFIRKNTPELRKKLEELGYEPCHRMTIHPDLYKNICVCSFFGSKYYGVTDVEVSRPGNIADAIKNRGMIDCGTNEELFLALAALRNDSDYMQWFIVPKTRTKQMSGCFGQTIGMDGHYKEIVGYEWYRHENKDNALTEKLNAMLQMEINDMEFLPHKATVEEIIEHFKDKK